MTEVEFPKAPHAVSSSCWSLGSNQYPSGRFPKVSIAIPVEKPKTGTSIHLSQEKPPEEQVKRLSQEITSERIPPHMNAQAVQKETLNQNLSDSLLGKRKEMVQEGAADGKSGLKLRLWEILGGSPQNKDATDSPRIRKEDTVTKLSQNQNSIEKGNTLKLSEHHSEKVNLPRKNPSSDTIETDSGSMKQAETRPVTRSLTCTRATPQVMNSQDRGKPEPVKNAEAYTFSFDEPKPKESGSRRKNRAGGSSTSNNQTKACKRAKIEPRKINFSKRPLVSGKETKETSANVSNHISSPSKERSESAKVSYQREKTVSLNSETSKKHLLQSKHDARNSMRTLLPLHANQANKDKEHSWEFPGTPPASTQEPQEKGIPNLINERNQNRLLECKRPAVVKSTTGLSTQRREAVQKPLASPTYNAKQQSNNVQSHSTDRNTNVLNKFKVTSLKTDTGVSTRSTKPVQFLATPATSNEMQSEKAASTNRSLSSGFKHSDFAKNNIGASTQRRKPMETVVSPIISNEVQPEKEASASAQRNHAESLESPVVGDHMQIEREIGTDRSIRVQRTESPVTSNDVQPEKNTHADRRSHNFNGHTYTRRKRAESPVRPVTSNEVQPEKSGDSPLRDEDISMSDYLKSPTFAMNGTSSSQRRKACEEVMDQPRNPKTPERSRSVSDSGSDSDVQPSDDTRNSPNMSEAKSLEVEVEYEAEKPCHRTSEKILKTKSSDANGFFKRGNRRTNKLSSSPDTPIEQSLPVKIRTKAKPVKIEVKRSTVEQSPPIPVGCSEESNESEDTPNQFPDNSLESAVCELATILKKLRSKMKTQQNKKSCDILSNVTEKIEKQLKDAELQMQENTRKLVVSSKTKKKELESKFQEQAEKLKVIHEKFKAEVGQYLMDCKSSLEEFDAFQIEFKVIADKQKAQHRKLVRHVEQNIAAQLTDAETKITRVQKEADKKMDGLKHALREWIAEGAT